MSTFNAGDIEAQLTLDRSAFQQELREARAAARKAEKDKIRLEAELSAATLPADIARIQAELDAIKDVKIEADLDAFNAQRQIIQIREDLRDIRGVHTAHVRVVEHGDSSRALRSTRLIIMSVLALAPLIPAAIVPGTAAAVGLGTALGSAAGGAVLLGGAMIGAVSAFKAAKDSGDGMTESMRRFGDAIDQIKGAWDGFVDATQNTSFGLMTQGLDIASTLLPRLIPVFNAFGEVAGRALGGIAAFMAGPESQRMLDFFATIGAQNLDLLLQALGNLTLFLGRLGEAFGPFSVTLMEGLVNMTARWAEWADGIGSNPAFQKFIAFAIEMGPRVLSMFGELFDALVNIGVALAPLAGPLLTGLTAAFDFIGNLDPSVLGAIIVAIGGFTFAIQAVTAATAIMNLVMAVNPFVLLGVAIAAAAAAIIYLWNTNEGFRNAIIGAWNAISAAVSPVVNWFAGVVGPTFITIWEGIQAAWADAQPLFAALGEIVGGVLAGAFETLRGVWEELQGPLENIKVAFENFMALVQPALAEFFKFADGFRSFFFPILLEVAGAIASVVGPALNWFIGALGWLIGALLNVGAFLFGFLGTVISVFGGIFDFLNKHMSEIRTIVTVGWMIISTVIGAVVRTVWVVVSTTFTLIWNTISTIMRVIWTVISTVWQTISTVFSTAVSVIRALISGNFSAIPGIISGALGRLGGIASGAFGSLVNIASSYIGTLLSTIGGIPGRITGALSGLGSLLVGIGRSLIEGLIRGVEGMIGSLREKFSSITSMIPDWKGPMDKDRVLLAPAGQAIMGGLIRSVERQIPALRVTMGRVTDEFALGAGLRAPTLAGAGSGAALLTPQPIPDQRPIEVTVHAPQNMDPEQAGRHVGAEVGYALDAHVAPLLRPAGSY